MSILTPIEFLVRPSMELRDLYYAKCDEGKFVISTFGHTIPDALRSLADRWEEAVKEGHIDDRYHLD